MSVLEQAEVLVVGPAPPLRGGIAAHTRGLVEYLRATGTEAAAASWSRLYPSLAFPGRSERGSGARPSWCDERLSIASPRTWTSLGHLLAASRATVIVQWWHPVSAPALLAATRRVAPERLVAVCHNVLPHEPVPLAAEAARRLLGRCGVVLCHSSAEAEVASRLLAPKACRVVSAPLPCLIPAESVACAAASRKSARIFLVPGHQRPYKNIAGVERAWSAARRPPEARLVIAGESYLKGTKRREVEKLAADDRSIILQDQYLDDNSLMSILASAEALVAWHRTSSQSGFLPLAAALGLPAIVSDAGGLPEQARALPDSDVVPAGDEAALATVFEARLAIPADRDEAARTAALRQLPVRIARSWQLVVEAIGEPLRR
ncbi:MAG TPA: glycosyltransferase family 4 protein [Candidatus Binatia bacterium]